MLALLSAFIAVLTFTARGRCDSTFLTPSSTNPDWDENRVYRSDDKLDVKWKTDHDGDCNLFVWQDYPKVRVEYFVKLLENTTDTSFAWNVSLIGYPADPGQDAVFHLALYSSKTDTPLANSASFNITQSKSTSTRTTASTTSMTSAAATAITTHIPASKPEKSGLSTAALVGVSVGVTVTGLLVSAAVGIFLWRRYARNRKAGLSTEEPGFSKAELGGTQVLQIGSSELDSPTKEPSELWDTQKRAELSDDNKIRSILGLHEAP